MECKEGTKGFLFDLPDDWEDKWQGMPEFSQKDMKPFDSINVQFRNQEDMSAFLVMLGESPFRKQTIWYPKMGNLTQSIRNAPPTKVAQNRYPIYVPTKGRWETALTIRSLEKLGLHYFAVIQPQEEEHYRPLVNSGTILLLPEGLDGLVPARNWIKDRSTAAGDARHWQIDDNIDGFYKLNNNLKVKVIDDNPFVDCEDFSDKFTNVAISGLQYEFFAARRSKHPPFLLNTRIYSCSLINNSIPHRYRDVYNDDTDICLRVLKDGYCTILFYAYLCKKMTTMLLKGGNTEIYQGDGRLEMAESLKRQHPDVVTITKKWGRWQHQVNYAPFKKNRLILKEEEG
jgi:hypothetical protein